jgi:hypothetical protein
LTQKMAGDDNTVSTPYLRFTVWLSPCRLRGGEVPTCKYDTIILLCTYDVYILTFTIQRYVLNVLLMYEYRKYYT